MDVVAVDGEGAFVPADGDLAVDLIFLPSQHWNGWRLGEGSLCKFEQSPPGRVRTELPD